MNLKAKEYLKAITQRGQDRRQLVKSKSEHFDPTGFTKRSFMIDLLDKQLIDLKIKFIFEIIREKELKPK